MLQTKGPSDLKDGALAGILSARGNASAIAPKCFARCAVRAKSQQLTGSGGSLHASYCTVHYSTPPLNSICSRSVDSGILIFSIVKPWFPKFSQIEDLAKQMLRWVSWFFYLRCNNPRFRCSTGASPQMFCFVNFRQVSAIGNSSEVQ